MIYIDDILLLLESKKELIQSRATTLMQSPPISIYRLDHQFGEVHHSSMTANQLPGVSGGLDSHPLRGQAPKNPAGMSEDNSVTVRQLARAIGRMTATTRAVPPPLYHHSL